jgi:hypothetical protein
MVYLNHSVAALKITICKEQNFVDFGEDVKATEKTAVTKMVEFFHQLCTKLEENHKAVQHGRFRPFNTADRTQQTAPTY